MASRQSSSTHRRISPFGPRSTLGPWPLPARAQTTCSTTGTDTACSPAAWASTTGANAWAAQWCQSRAVTPPSNYNFWRTWAAECCQPPPRFVSCSPSGHKPRESANALASRSASWAPNPGRRACVNASTTRGAETSPHSTSTAYQRSSVPAWPWRPPTTWAPSTSSTTTFFLKSSTLKPDYPYPMESSVNWS